MRIRKNQNLPTEAVSRRLFNGLGASDGGRRVAAEQGARLEGALARALERDAARVAAKHGDRSPAADRARARAGAHLDAADGMAARARELAVMPFAVAPDRAVVHGHVFAGRRRPLAGLRVVAVSAEKPLGESSTDELGYFKLDLPASGGAAADQPIIRAVASRDQPAGAPLATPARVELRVFRANQELARVRGSHLLEPQTLAYRRVLINE